MIYTIDKANLISEQLRKFKSGYAHHVAGQFANIDFWLQEVQASLQTIDGYNKRFNNIRDKQKEWVDAHGTIVHDFCRICGGKCELGSSGIPRPPTRMSSTELKEARKELVDAAYYFLIRCFRLSLLDREQLEIKCNELGTSIELSDVE